ncbi:hypothetical protein J2T10_002547 [Paenarthrobacter nicotinovorans]|uniref:Uncharacterized protein n=1 Tax=Paenarthrobacter nicotinovorans TaxID=29320 RepID=A0ABT9TMJ9_PAENI|nr:hypothetical protein [Paenarthrobacter nicotinovorans]MDQ0102894.1 hypothetical protein [Paenarthrobacter nicotinovorans]
MRHEETAAVERLTGADPGVAVTEEELARSREKSLAVRFTDSEQLVPGGSIDDFHQRRPRRRFRLAAGAGLAAAAVLAGVFVASSLCAPLNEQAGPAATPSAAAPETDSSASPSLPEIIGAKAATGAAEIVVGGNGNKAAVSTDQGVNVFMEALNSGRLGLNSGGCFAEIRPDGTSTGLIFPFGTQVTGTGVILPDGTAVNVGEDFAFGGGLAPGTRDPGVCSPTGAAFLVQSW